MEIAKKIKILFTNPALFFKIVKDVTKLHLGLGPKEPEEGKKFTTEAESMALQQYAAAAKVGVVEIGVLDGATTREFSKGCSVPIYGIDPIIPDSMNERLLGSEQKILNNMKDYPAFQFFKDFSYNLAKGWDKAFDFIFIDGDHTYEAVRQDFEDWLPLINPSGILAFHDSAEVTSVPSNGFPGWPGPIRLVSELKIDPRVEFVETRDSLSIFRKKG